MSLVLYNSLIWLAATAVYFGVNRVLHWMIRSGYYERLHIDPRVPLIGMNCNIAGYACIMILLILRFTIPQIIWSALIAMCATALFFYYRYYHTDTLN